MPPLWNNIMAKIQLSCVISTVIDVCNRIYTPLRKSLLTTQYNNATSFFLWHHKCTGTCPRSSMIKSIQRELISDILLMPVLHLPLERIRSDGCKGMMEVFFFWEDATKNGDVWGEEMFPFWERKIHMTHGTFGICVWWMRKWFIGEVMMVMEWYSCVMCRFESCF